MKNKFKTPSQIVVAIMVFAMLFVQTEVVAQNHQKAASHKSAPQKKSVSKPTGSNHSTTAKKPTASSS
jgi:hypothetical protein